MYAWRTRKGRLLSRYLRANKYYHRRFSLSRKKIFKKPPILFNASKCRYLAIDDKIY